MSEAKAIKLHEDIIIPSCGLKHAGEVVTKEEAGCSFQWLFDNQFGEECDPDMPVQHAEPEQSDIAVGDDAVSEETDVTAGESTDSDDEASASDTATETPVASEGDAEVIAIVRNALLEGKLQLKTILTQTGLTEEAVVPVLTKENGFTRNQQGWYSNV